MEAARLWDRLSPEAQDAALAVGRGRWAPLLGPALAGADSATRAAIAHLAARTGEAALVPVAASLVMDADRAVADAADESLVALCAAVADDPSAAAIETPVADLVRMYPSHRRRGVLVAAAALLGPAAFARAAAGEPAPLVAWFDDPSDPAHLALRSVLRRAPEPLLARRAWEWLGRKSVAAAALDRLAQETDPEALTHALGRAHLLANPARARAISSLRPGRAKPGAARRGTLVPGPAATAALPERGRRGVARWIGALGVADGPAESTASMLLRDRSTGVRYAAAAALPAACIAEAMSDPDPRISRTATLRLLDAAALEVADAAAMQPTVRPTDALARRLVDEERERRDPWRPDSVASRLAARRWLASDLEGFVRALRERLASDDPRRALAAVCVARRLGVQRQVELELLAIVRDRSPHAAPAPGAPHQGRERLIAAAVSALAEIPTDSAEVAVRACLAHPVDRVRANAVDGLAARAARGAARGEASAAAVSALRGVAQDPHHRVRANALRGLARLASNPEAVGQASAGLGAMLCDERPMHRVAALWAAGRVAAGGPAENSAGRGWAEVAARVVDVARHDPDPGIRARAAATSRTLAARTRLGWRGRAPALAEAVA